MKKFESGQLYVKYVSGYKVIYRITKRTAKKIYFMGVEVETDKPISNFDPALACSSGVIADIADLFKEHSVNVIEAQSWDYDYEYFTIWNNKIGPVGLSCLNKA